MLNKKKAVEELKSRIRLSDLAGRYTILQDGRNGEFKGLCPLHGEKSPSFKVDDDQGFYYCFGCKRHGDIISLVEEKERLDFIGAVQFLANQFNVDLSQFETDDHTNDPNYIPLEAYRQPLNLLQELFVGKAEGKALMRQWFDARGLHKLELEPSGVFYVPEGGTQRMLELLGNDPKLTEVARQTGMIFESRRDPGKWFCPLDRRIVFPVTRAGRIISFTASALERGEALAKVGGRKYINGAATPLFKKAYEVYGLDRAAQLNKPGVPLIVVEGVLDAEALLQYGYPAVSTLGTSISLAMLGNLGKKFGHVALFLDADGAGRRASAKLARESLAHDLKVQLSFLVNPTQLDPDELLSQHGPAMMDQILAKPKTVVDYVIDHGIRDVLSSLAPEAKKDAALVKRLFLNETLTSLHDYQTNISHYQMVERLAERLSIEFDVLTRMLNKGVEAAKTTIRREVRQLPAEQLTTVHMVERRAVALIRHHPRLHERMQREGAFARMTPLVRGLCQGIYDVAISEAGAGDLHRTISQRMHADEVPLALELYSLATQTYRDPEREADALLAQLTTRSSDASSGNLTSMLRMTGRYQSLVAAGTARPLQVAVASALLSPALGHAPEMPAPAVKPAPLNIDLDTIPDFEPRPRRSESSSVASTESSGTPPWMDDAPPPAAAAPAEELDDASLF